MTLWLFLVYFPSNNGSPGVRLRTAAWDARNADVHDLGCPCRGRRWHRCHVLFFISGAT